MSNPIKTTLESMKLCPKFDSCSAPICPLDRDWQARTMTSSDATCIWLREIVKGGPEAAGVPELIRFRVAEALPAILSSQRLSNLRHALNKAAKCASKRDTTRLRSLRKPTNLTRWLFLHLKGQKQ